ncbi:MAG: hypothetical protein ACRD5F_00930 [Candidatus Acidiferrales bacterium]
MKRPKPRAVASLLLALLALFGAAPAAVHAQVFEARGGSSTLLDTHGGSLILYGENYTARVGLGFADGRPRPGFQLNLAWREMQWDLGDQAIPFVLATDLANTAYSFFGRGVGITRKNADGSTFFVFGGATAEFFSTPFVASATADTPAGALFWNTPLSPSVRFSSYNVFSGTQTSIQALDWRPKEHLKLAFSGGMGSNQPYWGTSLDYDWSWISVDAGYSRAGRNFRRIRVQAPQVTESDRELIRVELRPRHWLGFSALRQNYLIADAQPGTSPRVAVTGLGAWATLLETQVHGSWYRSHGASGSADSLMVGGRRSITSRLQAGADYLRSRPERGAAIGVGVVSLREVLTRRLSLTQIISIAARQRSVAFGGHFVSNRVTIGVDYQTVYTPLLVPGRTQFRQVLGLTLRFQLPHNLQASLDTHVSPLGQTRYSAHMTSFFYRGFGAAPGSLPSGAFAENIVRGRVVDVEGQPVRGAALLIDSELVFTNSNGEFFLRRKKAKEYVLQVLLDQFALPGRYEIVAAPALVRALPEDQAEFVQIILRRRPAGPPSPAPDDEETAEVNAM